jgi:predicted transcriptional regulator
VVCAHLTTSRLYPLSWFNLQLLRRGVNLYVGRAVRIMQRRRVEELLAGKSLVLAPQTDIGQAREELLRTNETQALVCDENGTLCGQINLTDVIRTIDSRDADITISKIATMPAVVLAVNDDLNSAMKQLRYFTGADVPVVQDIHDMRLVGVIEQSSVIGAYADAVAQAHDEEHGRG